MKDNAWLSYNETQKAELEALSGRYKKFLDAGKTERECATEAIRLARAAGYVSLEEVQKAGKTLQPGDKVYACGMKKMLVLFQIGKQPLENGLRILGAHIDSPRLDLKQNPMYEDTELAYLDTHYYGGVKKYQWVTIPLAIHGVVAKKDGSVVEISVGEKEEDPVVFISDLLIHLAGEQLEKKAKVVIEGENLDILVGSRPTTEKDEDGKTPKDAVKANILALLKEQYDIEEDDFLSAELEIVPAAKARDCGLDRSMIMAYGQDDRVCAYTSLEAQLAVPMQERTTCCLLVDKEEIGSVGATGMQSRFFENTVAELLDRMGGYSDLALRRTLANSKMLSSDVNAAYDPLYADAYEKRNSSMAGCGMVFNKFTGARGKSGSNDANAEYIAEIRHIMDEAGVRFQLAELGKVDVGGGGTIAYILALYGMNVIDCGVAVLNMHAPWEITSKADIYETKRGYEVFLRDMK